LITLSHQLSAGIVFHQNLKNAVPYLEDTRFENAGFSSSSFVWLLLEGLIISKDEAKVALCFHESLSLHQNVRFFCLSYACLKELESNLLEFKL
jgi:hypothetical protein